MTRLLALVLSLVFLGVAIFNGFAYNHYHVLINEILSDVFGFWSGLLAPFAILKETSWRK